MDNLYFLPLSEIRRIRNAISDKFLLCEVLADLFRINALYMIAKAGSGHIGSTFSSLDIVTWLWLEEMANPNEVEKSNADIYFSSKGHDVPGLYSILIGLEKISFDYLHRLRRLGGLPGHPQVETPYIMANTGPLGTGISKARGMAIARRLGGKTGQIYVLTGDGELQEGQFWESLPSAVNGRFSEITVIIDNNKIQSDTYVKEVSDPGDLEKKLSAFGWEVGRCDGHDFNAVKKVLANFKIVKDRPQILIADTVKGKGVSFMEKVSEDGFYKFHSGAPSPEQFQAAIQEITGRVNNKLQSVGVSPLKLESVEKPASTAPKNVQKLVPAYGDELLKIARERTDVIALDADLVLDTGLIPFKKEFPERFVECGIAEQDMVSVAGGLALRGMLPVVHSFACFLSARPNEQIYNNASERTKIIYAASLAGLLPASPGHSHQSVRDISCVGSIPGLTLIQPSCEQESRLAIRWAVEKNPESTYLRLTSIPCETLFELPKDYSLSAGRGVFLKEGGDALVIGYGPMLLGEAIKAADKLEKQGIAIAVMNFPWLNRLDAEWLAPISLKYKTMITLDDHYVNQGQGAFILSEVAKVSKKLPRVISLGLKKIPESGQPAEVLKHHRLDFESLAATIKKSLPAGDLQ